MDPALEIMAEARAYFQGESIPLFNTFWSQWISQVAYKRFGDNVPNQIDASFVSRFDDDLELALVYAIPDSDMCREWLQESPQVARRREALKSRKDRLEAAKDKLAPIVRLLSRSIFTEPSSPPPIAKVPLPPAPSPPSDIAVDFAPPPSPIQAMPGRGPTFAARTIPMPPPPMESPGPWVSRASASGSDDESGPIEIGVLEIVPSPYPSAPPSARRHRR